MFAPYNLVVSDFDKFNFLQTHGSKKRNCIIDEIISFSDSENILDCSKIQNDWFPTLNFDIFISHSHKDQDLANALADYIEARTSLKVFVDGMVWQNADQLQQKLDDNFSLIDESNPNLYSYRKVLATSSNVNAMLSMAIMKLMDKTDVIFLLNTKNSVITIDDVTNKTMSPWLFEEWLFTQKLRIKKNTKPARQQTKQAILESKKIQTTYDLPKISDYTKLTIEDIISWLNECKTICSSYNILEKLYEHFNPYIKKEIILS